MAAETFRSFAKQYFEDRGMFPRDAEAVIASMESLPSLGLMQGRWDDPTEGYPVVMKAALSLHFDWAALAWIDANIPLAWFRPMFTGDLVPDAQ